MDLLKKPRITNLWSKVVDGENEKWLTRVTVESTGPYKYTLKEVSGGFSLECFGVEINMPLWPLPCLQRHGRGHRDRRCA